MFPADFSPCWCINEVWVKSNLWKQYKFGSMFGFGCYPHNSIFEIPVEAVPQFLWNFAVFWTKHRPWAFGYSFIDVASKVSEVKHWLQNLFFDPSAGNRKRIFDVLEISQHPSVGLCSLTWPKDSTPEDGRQVTTKGVFLGGIVSRFLFASGAVFKIKLKETNWSSVRKMQNMIAFHCGWLVGVLTVAKK